MTVYENPTYFSGPILRKAKQRAADSKTWRPGAFARRTDSGWVPCKELSVSIGGLLLENQPSATSSSDVWVGVIPSSETRFKIGCVKAGSAHTAAKGNPALIGSTKALAVADSICVLATGCDTSTIALKVVDVIANVEPTMNDTSDTVGFAIVTVPDAILNADPTGNA